MCRRLMMTTMRLVMELVMIRMIRFQMSTKTILICIGQFRHHSKLILHHMINLPRVPQRRTDREQSKAQLSILELVKIH